MNILCVILLALAIINLAWTVDNHSEAIRELQTQMEQLTLQGDGER